MLYTHNPHTWEPSIYALGIQTRNSTNVCKLLLWAEGVLLCAQMGTWRNYVYPTSEKPCQNIPPKQMISLVLVFHQHTSLTTCFIHEFDFSEIGMQSWQAQVHPYASRATERPPSDT